MNQQGPAGNCPTLTGSKQADCLAYNYGYNSAQLAMSYAGPGASSPMWWLDIEKRPLRPVLSCNQTLNSLTIQGALTTALTKVDCGIYSTARAVAGHHRWLRVPPARRSHLVAGAYWTLPPTPPLRYWAPSPLASYCTASTPSPGVRPGSCKRRRLEQLSLRPGLRLLTASGNAVTPALEAHPKGAVMRRPGSSRSFGRGGRRREGTSHQRAPVKAHSVIEACRGRTARARRSRATEETDQRSRRRSRRVLRSDQLARMGRGDAVEAVLYPVKNSSQVSPPGDRAGRILARQAAPVALVALDQLIPFRSPGWRSQACIRPVGHLAAKAAGSRCLRHAQHVE